MGGILFRMIGGALVRALLSAVFGAITKWSEKRAQQKRERAAAAAGYDKRVQEEQSANLRAEADALSVPERPAVDRLRDGTF